MNGLALLYTIKPIYIHKSPERKMEEWRNGRMPKKASQHFFHLFFKMRKITIFVLVALIACAWGYDYYYNTNYNSNADKVLLSSVQTLTFSKSKYTTGRRSRFVLSLLIILDPFLKWPVKEVLLVVHMLPRRCNAITVGLMAEMFRLLLL